MFSDEIKILFEQYLTDNRIRNTQHLGIPTDKMLNMFRKKLGMSLSRKSLWRWVEVGAMNPPNVLSDEATSELGKRYFFTLDHIYELMALHRTIWFFEFVQRKPPRDGGKTIDVIEKIGHLKQYVRTPPLPEDQDWYYDREGYDIALKSFDFSDEKNEKIFQLLFWVYRFHFQWIIMPCRTEDDVIKVVYCWEKLQEHYREIFGRTIEEATLRTLRSECPRYGSDDKMNQGLPTLGDVLRVFCDRPKALGYGVCKRIDREINFIRVYYRESLQSRLLLEQILSIVFCTTTYFEQDKFAQKEMETAFNILLENRGIIERPHDICMVAQLLY